MMANYSPRGTVLQRKKVNNLTHSRRKNANKETNAFKLFGDIDPDTGKKILRPFDFEALRMEDAAATGTALTKPQKRPTNHSTIDLKKCNGFDPVTEKPILVPLDIESIQREIAKTDVAGQQSQKSLKLSGKKRSAMESLKSCNTFDVEPGTGNKFLHPLDMKTFRYDFLLDDSEKPSKLRKIETLPHPIRKGLFATNELNPKTIKTRSSFVSKKVEPKTFSPKLSPLINMEEAEKEFVNKRGLMSKYCFKSPIIEEEEEPMTPNSTAEFNKNELMCLENNGYIESPITAISNLMQGTGINSVKETKLDFSSNLDSTTFINDIKRLIQEEETRHKATMLMLNNLLLNFMKLTQANTNKENTPLRSTRRSIRLQKKSPLVQNIGKLLPAFQEV